MIPKEAKLVFQGIIFDVYQWEQKMYDGTTAKYEKLKRPNTIRIIAISGNQILLCKEEQPHKPKRHVLFGGRQDKGETSLEAAKRELLEEAGLISDDWEHFATYTPQPKMEWEHIVFIARNCRKKQQPQREPGEKIEDITVDFDEFIKLIRSPEFYPYELALQILRMDNLEEFKERLGL